MGAGALEFWSWSCVNAWGFGGGWRKKKAVQNEDILFDSQFNKGLFESYNLYVKVRGVRALITVWVCVQGVLVSPVALILLSFRLLDPNISEALTLLDREL